MSAAESTVGKLTVRKQAMQIEALVQDQSWSQADKASLGTFSHITLSKVENSLSQGTFWLAASAEVYVVMVLE